MTKNIKKGEHVEWNWGNGTQDGTVTHLSPSKTTRKIKGETVSRNGTKDNPALSIKDKENGNRVLKKASEVHKKG